MNTKSEKNIYENKLQMKAVRFCTDIFVWGEDLTDKKLIIYPQKLKYIDDYISKKDRLKACGVVLIDPEDSDPVHLVTATVDIESGDLYVHESGFNPMWKYLRNSINAGIKMSWENTGKCAIAEPEEVVVSDYIQRPGLSRFGLFAGLSEDMKEYGKEISQNQKENIVNVMMNEFPAGVSKKTYSQCIFIEKEGSDYKPTKAFLDMLSNDEFYNIFIELVEFGISRYKRDYRHTYEQTDFVLYQKYTYEDVCRLLNWSQNEVPLNIGGYKFDKKQKHFLFL